MTIFKGLLLSTLLLSLAACSERESSDSASAVKIKTEAEKPSGVIPQHHLKAMEKANQVEGMLQKSEQDLRAKIDNDS